MDSRRSTLQFVVATLILGSLAIFATQVRLDVRTWETHQLGEDNNETKRDVVIIECIAP